MRNLAVSLMILVLLFVNLPAGCESGDFRKTAGGEEAYAWTDDYLFVASSYRLENELEDWISWHYSVSSINRQTKEKRLLVKEVYGQDVSLFIDGDGLYILWEMEGECYSVGLMKLSVRSGLVNLVTTLNLEYFEYLRDAIVYNGNIILVTSSRVMEWDYYETQTLHVFRGEVGNSIYSNHVIIDEDILYCLEDSTIWAIDLITHSENEVRQVSTVQNMSFKNRTDRQRITDWNYDYIIKHGILYYYDTNYDTDYCATIAVDLSDSESTVLTEDEVYFYSISNDQVAYSIIKNIDWELSATTYILGVSGCEKLDLEHGQKVQWYKERLIPIGHGEFYKPDTSELIKQ